MTGLFGNPPSPVGLGQSYDETAGLGLGLGGYSPPGPPPEPPLMKAVARGISGRTYEFEINPIGGAYRKRPGVYMFIKMPPNGAWDILYIGETMDFNDRLNANLIHHHRWQSVCAAGATHIGTLYVPGALVTRESFETDLRKAYKPPCNLQ